MKNSEKVILDLCGGTGAWSAPYQEAGYDVRLITLPDNDVRLFEYIDVPVWGILAAPPCQHFSSSGARWWKQKGDGALLEGLSVVDACLRIISIYGPQWWALENPVGRLRHYLGDPALIFDPCDYGDPYTKKTLLWGNFTQPQRSPVVPVEGSRMHLYSSSESLVGERLEGLSRNDLRAITPSGFARAFFLANP